MISSTKQPIKATTQKTSGCITHVPTPLPLRPSVRPQQQGPLDFHPQRILNNDTTLAGPIPSYIQLNTPNKGTQHASTQSPLSIHVCYPK